TDLGLLLEGGAAIQVQQIGLAWTRRTSGGLEFSLGAQYLRAHTLPSAVSLISHVLDRALAEESVERLTAHLLGLTGHVRYPIGRFRLGAAFGQLLPLSLERELAPSPAPPSPEPSPKAAPGWLQRLRDTLRSTSGGSRLAFQVEVDFWGESNFLGGRAVRIFGGGRRVRRSAPRWTTRHVLHCRPEVSCAIARAFSWRSEHSSSHWARAPWHREAKCPPFPPASPSRPRPSG